MSQFYLSPSRAADFKNCPQLYKYRAVDRLPEPPSRPATIGSVVHLALQYLFDEAPADRVPDLSDDLVAQAWPRIVTPEVADSLFASEQTAAEARAEAVTHVRSYFLLEDPRRLEPVGRELRLAVPLEVPAPRRSGNGKARGSGQHPEEDPDARAQTAAPATGANAGRPGPLQADPAQADPDQANPGQATSVHVVGVLDRVDRSADGTFVVSDYKTGRVPDLGRSLPSFFGLQVYALLLEKALGVVPERLRLLYLKGPEAIAYEPRDNDLAAIERQLGALGTAVRRAHDEDDWRPRPSRLCDYCAFVTICPAHSTTEPADPTQRGAGQTGPAAPPATEAASPDTGEQGPEADSVSAGATSR